MCLDRDLKSFEFLEKVLVNAARVAEVLAERAFSFQQRFMNRDFLLDVRLPLVHERVEPAFQSFFQALFFSRDSAERGFGSIDFFLHCKTPLASRLFFAEFFASFFVVCAAFFRLQRC